MRILALFAAAFSGGIFLAQYLLPHDWLPPCAAAAFLFACTRLVLPESAGKISQFGRRVLLIGTGLSLAFSWNWLYAQRSAIPAAALSGREREVSMTLCGYAAPSAYGARVTVQITDVSGVSSLSDIPGSLSDIPGISGLFGVSSKAVYYGNADLLELEPGQIVRDTVRFQDASRTREDTITTFTSKGIFLLAYSQKKPIVEESGSNFPLEAAPPTLSALLSAGPDSLRWYPIRLGRAVREKVQTLLADDSAAFLSAMLTGDRSGISIQASADLSETGITHILAVSGMHCGFLLALITLLSGRQRRRLIAAATIPLLVFYAVLTGGNPPVVRAGIMLSLLVLAPLFRRKADALTSLFTALFLILLHNPYAAASAGLQLSFGSVAGLFCVSPKLYGRMTANLETNTKTKGKQTEGDQEETNGDQALAIWKNRVIRFIAASISASVGALVFTIPLTALYFGLLALIAPISNLLCLWAAGGVFSFGLAAVLIGFVCPPLAVLLAVIPDLLIRYLLSMVHLLAKLPFHAVYFANPYLSIWLVYAYLLFVAAYLAGKANRKSIRQSDGKASVKPVGQSAGNGNADGKRLYAMAFILTAAALALVLRLGEARYHSAMDAVILDVGQGESIILASQGHFALVDCGSGNSWIDAGNRAAQQLGSMGCRRLDALILTHYDSDHVNGVASLLARIDADALYAPETEEKAGTRTAVLNAAQAAEIPICFPHKQIVIPFGGGKLILFPPLGTGGDNEIGLSILASAGETDFLITGDMGSETERKLIRAYAPPDGDSADSADTGTDNANTLPYGTGTRADHVYSLPDLEILMAGHHGSRYSTCDEFLSALAPEIACISVGSNSYGHPAADTLQRLKDHGCTVYRTDLDGNIHAAFR